MSPPQIYWKAAVKKLLKTLYPDLQILKQSFSSPQTQTYEIILTLGQAFEVAYQMAIQSRARQYVPPSSLGSEVIETKTSRPVSQSWSSMRRSAVSTTLHTKKEACSCERVELAVEGEQKHGAVQSWYRKGYRDLMADFLPAAQCPMGHLQRKICCVCGRKWWVITLLPISSHPNPDCVSPSDQKAFSCCAYGKHDEWIVLFVAYRRVYDFLWDCSQGCALPVGPIRCFLTAEWVCCVNVHVYPERGVWCIDLSGCI